MCEQHSIFGLVIVTNLLKLKKLLIKLLTFFIFPEKLRKNVRNFLFYFSYADYIRFKKQNFHIVSLGCDCLPRVLTTAVKLKPRKIYGEKTLPFDLCRSFDLSKTIKLIETDFENYFDNLNISKELYPHDYKLIKEHFIIRYKKRISNFLELMKSEKSIYFIYADFDNLIDANAIKKLYSVLENKRNGRPFRIIILTAKDIIISNPDIYVIIQDFKINDGTWIKSFINDYGEIDDKYSRFCRKVGDEIKKCLQ